MFAATLYQQNYAYKRGACTVKYIFKSKFSLKLKI